MSISTNITRSAQTTLLCTSLFVVNGVWSKDCVESAGVSAIETSASGAEARPVTMGTQISTSLAPATYALFHDRAFNEPDGLGDYMEDFGAASHN
jgi:hypothetical protein